MSNKHRSIKYFRNKRKLLAQISEATLGASATNNVLPDQRPYASIHINGVEINGLLDSGASISALGKDAVEFIQKHNLFLHSMPACIQTADGTSQKVLGYVKTKITYAGKSATVNLLVVPSLQQPLYLGCDFWDSFGLKPMMVSEINPCKQPKSDPNNSQLIRHHLTVDQEARLQLIIESLPSFERLGLGRTHLLCHQIDVGNATPIKQRHYAVSPAVQREMYEELDRMLALNVIEESYSPWNSPMALVRKSNGKVRLCMDARRLNEITKKDAYPLPLIEGLLSRLDQTKYISTLDLKDAFWQIPLDSESREKTAFTIPGRPLYQFRVMPFGLCNAPQTLCRLMHKVIPHHLHDRVFVYLDDLLITTASLEEHLSLLSDISNRLSNAGLTINVEKSRFVLKEIEYLGYVVGEGGLRPNLDKVRAIAEFPTPKTVRQVRRFLGVAGWYRRFVSGFSVLSAPLTNLLKKGKQFQWNGETQKSFDCLKSALVSSPVLATPDYSKRFFIQCDASSTGIGAVLFQKDEENSDRPLAYMSQKLNAAQRNYSVTELECLAAVQAIKKFRSYVEGLPFTVITDHASLTWLMSSKDITGRLARWSLKLQGYNFDIEYRKGTQNIVPDALSRVNMDELNQLPTPVRIDLNSPAFGSVDYVDMVKEIESCSRSSNVRVLDGKAYLNIKPHVDPAILGDITPWKLIVPTSLRASLIDSAHCAPSSAHLGIKKTTETLQRYYYWVSLKDDVSNFIRTCDLCKRKRR